MTPLAESLRPKTFEEVIGQSHLVGENGWFSKALKAKVPLSILLWGPPGVGKTTIAKLYAKSLDLEFLSFSPIFQGVTDLKKAIQERTSLPLFKKRPIVFVDEIHRFNKAQQDAFLPFVENGTITLIGATTENPSFALNNALLSRLHVLTLSPLSLSELSELVTRFENAHGKLPLEMDARERLPHLSQGDGRYLINMLEILKSAPESPLLNEKELFSYVQKKAPLYDKGDDGHYNLISALHKSIRGSDPDAALYWLLRMLKAGESPQFIARRLIRMASEDVGLSDTNALSVCINAWKAFEHLGSPEGELALAEACVYLALAPKSNAIYKAYKKAEILAQNTGHLSPPKTILNAPTKLMKEMDYGKDYIYDHDTPQGFSGQNYFPDGMERPEFYSPIERGFERELKKRIEYFNLLRKNRSSES